MSPRKYRAWDEDNEVVYYSDAGWNETHPESEDCIFDFHKGHVVAFLRQTEPGTIDEPPYDYGEPVDVEQYTGLKDTKRTEEFPDGQPVCEGDIVKSIWQVDHKTKIVGQVKYYSVFALYSLMDSKGDMVSPCWNECEVIGNIHQNPELLEDK